MLNPAYTLRRANLADLNTLVEHRTALILERGGITDPAQIPLLAEANRKYFEEKMPSEKFIAWVAEINGEIVATNGLVFFERPPHAGNLSGMEAYIMNMYTLPRWRRQGIASAMLLEAVQFVKKTPARRIFLHARFQGRSVFIQSGFSATGVEMEYTW